MNNPYKYTDPDGEVAWVPIATAGGLGVLAGGIHGYVHYKATGDLKGAIAHGAITGLATAGSILAPMTGLISGSVRAASAASAGKALPSSTLQR